MRAETFKPAPETWRDVMDFIKVKRLDTEEYFNLDREFRAEWPIWEQSGENPAPVR